MRRLVCSLRKHVARGRVRLLYLRPSFARAFDSYAAEAIKADLAEHGLPFLLLTGNYHARNDPSSIVGMLKGSGLQVIALTASSPDAETWSCTREGCGRGPAQMAFCGGQPSAP